MNLVNPDNLSNPVLIYLDQIQLEGTIGQPEMV